MSDCKKKSIVQRLAEAKVICAMRVQNQSSDETEAAASSSDTSPIIERGYSSTSSFVSSNELPEPECCKRLNKRLEEAKQKVEEEARQKELARLERQRLGLEPPHDKRRKRDDWSR